MLDLEKIIAYSNIRRQSVSNWFNSVIPLMSQDILQQLKQIAEKVDRLASFCEQLQIENESLKTKQQELVRNRTQLIECTALVKSRVESMITRLKTLGQGN